LQGSSFTCGSLNRDIITPNIKADNTYLFSGLIRHAYTIASRKEWREYRMQSSRTVEPPPVRVVHGPESQQLDTPVKAPRRRTVRPALFVLAACLVLPVLALVAFGIAFNERVYPGVKVLGADLGGKSRSEAIAAVNAASAGYPSGDVQVSGENHVWTLAPA